MRARGKSSWVLTAALAVSVAPGCERAPASPEEATPEHAAKVVEADARIVPAADVMVPDETLVDQDGHPVRIRELFADRVVAINFVFTTCTTICSPMSAIFGRLQSALGPAMERKVRLVSISLDPATDTPEKLREYADRFDRRAGWTFLTGPPDHVARVLRGLGGQPLVREEHRPLTLIGSASEWRWQRVHGIAPPDRLAAWIQLLVHP